MKWFKRLSWLLGGLLLGGILIVAAVVLFLDESDHKRLLTWGADQFLDSRLVIEGPLRIDIARDLSLVTDDIRLEANDGSYRLSVGNLKTNFRVGSYLQNGVFWFNSLELTDVDLEVTESKDDDFDLDDIHIPPVIITRAQFNNLAFNYRERPPGTLHRFSLDEFTIEESGRQQPVQLQATGLFEERPFVLEGTTDHPARLLEEQGPGHVQLTLSGAQASLRVEGTIADAVNGRGLDLQVRADIPQTSQLIEILWDEIPVLGSLQGTLEVHGDYAAPRLEAIDLHLQREQEVELTVKGSVNDALAGTGIDLQIDGQSSNPEVLSWLLFKKPGRMQRVDIKGRLQGDIAQPSLHDLDVTAETAAGLKLELDGNAVVHPAGHRLEQTDAGLSVQFSAPSLQATGLPGLQDIPVPGPVTGKAKLAPGMDAIGIYAADIDIGRRNDSRIQLKGDVGYVILEDEPALSGLRLATDIQSAELARLGKQFDYPLPALGPARLRGTLVSRGRELLLQGARLDIDIAEQTTLQATGIITTKLHDPVRFRVAMDTDIKAAELARLGEQFDLALPELGETRINGRFESTTSGWLFRDAQLEVGAVEAPVIRATGKVTTDTRTGSTIDAGLDVAVAELITAYTDLSPGDLGRLQGDAVISSLDGKWDIEKFSLASAQTDIYRLNLDGRYNDLMNHDEARIETRLAIADPEKAGKVFGFDLAGLAPYDMHGLLKVEQGRARFDGTTTLGNTQGKTSLNGLLQDGRALLGGSIEVPVMYLADFGLGPAAAGVADRSTGDEPVSTHVFSRKPLKVGFLNMFDLDMELFIDGVESGELRIDSVKGRLQLHDGHLQITPLRLVFEGGNTDINLDIRASEIPRYQLAIIADDLVLGPLMAQVQDQVPIRGYTNVDLDLKTEGRSPHEMASNLSGNVSLGLENARIPRDDVEFLSVDVFGWVVARAGARQYEHLNLNCLLLTFTVDDGAVTSETFLADGPRLGLGGQINMDLGAETLDIVIIPKQKKHIFSSISPITVEGPMKNPNVTAVPVKAALQEIGAMALLPGVMIPARAIGKLWSLVDDGDQVGDGCAGLEELRKAAENQANQDKAPTRLFDWLRE